MQVAFSTSKVIVSKCHIQLCQLDLFIILNDKSKVFTSNWYYDILKYTLAYAQLAFKSKTVAK